jgi:nucleoside-diphosphate-sugar epimerase
VYRAVYDKAVVIFEGHFKRNFIHIRDVARGFIHSINNFEKMKGKPYNLGLEDANLSKLELCERIKKQLVNFIYLEESIGEDPDKRDYIVSNKRILETGFTTNYALDSGIKELIKAYTIVKNNQYTNI